MRGDRPPALGLEYLPGGQTPLVPDSRGGLVCYDARSGERLNNRQLDTRWARAVDTNCDHDLLLVGDDDGSGALYSCTTRAKMPDLGGTFDAAPSVAISPSGHLQAGGFEDGTIRIWDLATGLELDTLGPYWAPLKGLAFSPDRTLLASASMDGTIRLWGEFIR